MMNRKGPIIVIEDDPDDQQMMCEIFAELKLDNELMLLPDGAAALKYLEQPSVKPFLVISDINLPRMSGMEVRAKIDQHPETRIRCVPYVFLSTASSESTICSAYTLSVQGFFVKPDNFSDLKETIRCIVNYWQIGKAPNNP